MTAWIVTGTDTGIGKTMVAAALAGALDARYWKPVQAGLDDGSDSAAVATLSGLPAGHIPARGVPAGHPLAPRTARPRWTASPSIPPGSPCPRWRGRWWWRGPAACSSRSPATCSMPICSRAGPPRSCWSRAPRSARSTTACCRSRRCAAAAWPSTASPSSATPVKDSETTICTIGKVRRLGRLPWLPVVNRRTLARAFADNFAISDFEVEGQTPPPSS